MSDIELNRGVCIYTPNKIDVHNPYDLEDQLEKAVFYRYKFHVKDDYIVIMKKEDFLEGLFVEREFHDENQVVHKLANEFPQLGIEIGYNRVRFTMIHYNGFYDYFSEKPKYQDLFD